MQVGVWQGFHEAVLRRLREYDQIIWDQMRVNAASVLSPFGGEHTGRNPTDRLYNPTGKEKSLRLATDEIIVCTDLFAQGS